ncbi:stonin-1 [Latimeria chalumnae]|uniref:Stonin-1 n=1 Tax=Latimeria chalumnae TaxID=7897 RepID=M3XJG9_LATCH|nr:PREDICTED: stonin-1 [Latimeria chalumnae]XP_014345873.1 PREDICTED: stonin-1 [Latimeria chalumnae]|eukprot:XP_005999341.1 PREDICTED: stonin-1 [Latimeria chalumnae]
MCSTNQANWVTFDDDFPSQSPPKSSQLIIPRPNGLKLSLPGLHESSSGSSSSSSTPLSSPLPDFRVSPGPPSNTPLCTPIRDYPVSPCTPKAGFHSLYGISGKSTPNTPLASPGSDFFINVPSTNKTPLTSSIIDCPLSHPAGKQETQMPVSGSPSRNNIFSNLEIPSPTNKFKPFQNESGYSNPFWRQKHVSGTSLSESDQHNSVEDCAVNLFHGESRSDQKKTINSSFTYICKKLEGLQADNLEKLRNSSSYSEANSCSFVSQSLFRSRNQDGWPFMLRIPEKKNMMSSRQWGPIYLKVVPRGILQMYYEKGLEKPFKELQLHPYCRLSEQKLESFGDLGKIHTIKIENVSYIEKRRYHPKAEVVHEAELEQLLKLGTTDYNDFSDFIITVEEELMRLPLISKQKKNYEEQEMILEIIDNFWGKITKDEGKLIESAVVTHIYCLCFINGSTECFLTLNDLQLQRKDDSYFEEGIKDHLIEIGEYSFHKCVKEHEFENSRIIKFIPPDACRVELLRFKSLCNMTDIPFSIKALVMVQGAYIELQAFLNMAPTRTDSLNLKSLKYCENVMIRFPVPAGWIKVFRTVNLLRQKSLKAKMNRSACLGSINEMESEPVVQVTIGAAKYENAYKAIVWKIDRLPDKNSASDHPHCFSCKLELGSDQEIPFDWYPFITVEFEMPGTYASGTNVKSVGTESDIQPQKHILQKACYHYQVEVDKKWISTEGEDPEKSSECTTQ